MFGARLLHGYYYTTGLRLRLLARYVRHFGGILWTAGLLANDWQTLSGLLRHPAQNTQLEKLYASWETTQDLRRESNA